MSKTKLVLGFAILVLAVSTVGQIGVAEWDNLELQDDFRDVSSMAGARIGVNAPQSDDDLRNAIVRKAYRRGIYLEPKQVTVRRTGTPEAPVVWIGADYEVRVTLPGYSFPLHFTPSSAKKGS